MSRPLVVGLITEGRSDRYFLEPLVLRQVGSLLEQGARRTVALADDVATCPRATMVSDEALLHVEAAELARRCHLLFVHSDWNERGKAEKLAESLSGGQARTVVLAPRRETEAWMLADARAFRRLRGADVAYLPTASEAVEKEPDPKSRLRQVMAQVTHNRAEDYFESLGQSVDLTALAKVPAYADWVTRTTLILKELHFL
ncbi:hypothetical protein [Yinghuangia sp. YIM S09857]|uniref:hypothetical protein n=1 Tax=Yinghuangia sp. YIM S09857 TaxID=3436929 RepID=UPI003F52F85F